jgi:predicted TIM-barrel fold metal-dependent hydrolase
MKEVSIAVKSLSKRMEYLPVEGGALNASYTFVDAVANICSQMGNAGYVYGRDYYWAYHGYDEDLEDCVTLCVKDEKMKTWIHLNAHCGYHIKHTADGEAVLTKVRK